MFIQEAVRLASQQGKHIQRKIHVSENGWQEIKILPTDEPDCCIVSVWEYGKKVSHCRCWNPEMNDLLADDWQLAD